MENLLTFKIRAQWQIISTLKVKQEMFTGSKMNTVTNEHV